MALFGPRLDRPTALGDEGRPRATSLTVASLLVFTALIVSTTCPWNYGLRFDGGIVPTLVVPACASLGQFALGIATLTGLMTAGVALSNRERFASLFIGQIILLPPGTALVGGLAAMLFVRPAYGVFFGGFAIALLALGSTWTDTASASSVRPALFQEGLTYVSILLWAAFGVMVYLAVLLVRATVSATDPTVALFVFLLLVGASAILTRIGLRWLPIRQLTQRHRRATVDAVLARVRRIDTILIVGSVVGVVVALPLSFLGVFSILYRVVPFVPAVFRLFGSGPVVAVVVGLGLFSVLLGLVALGVRRLTRPVETRSNRLLAPFVAGLFLTLGMLPFTFSLLPIPLPVTVVVLAVLFGPIALYVIGWTLVLAEYASILPARAGGPALAAGGMVVATVGAALIGLPGPLVVALAAVAMIVWDVSAFGLGVTAELGHLPETRRLELFHAVVAVAVGAVTVLVVGLLAVARTTVAGDRAVLVAAGLAVFGVLVLLLGVRGYAAREAMD